MTELTFALLKFGFLVLLWVFVLLAIRSLHKDIETFSPRSTRERRRRERKAHKAVSSSKSSSIASSPSAQIASAPSQQPQQSAPAQQTASSSDLPTLLVVIDGPLAGTSVPLTDAGITMGRSASNTVVMDDEFVSSHHARIYKDQASGQWAIEDLGSTNGTVVNQQRINTPVILPARVPVRIGATTLELR